MATAKEVLALGEAMVPENEAVVGQNNTSVNRRYGMVGQPYCGGFVMDLQKRAGTGLLNGCSNPWYVPTLRQFMEAQGWPRVSTPQPGDIWIEGDDQHTGYCDEYLGGGYMLTLEGNYGHVKGSKADAKNGTGTAYEGIGYRKAALGNFKIFRPPYDAGGKEPAPVPAPEPDPEPVKTPDDYVKEWQSWLGVDPDGDPGTKTEDANFQRIFVALAKAHPAKIGDKGDYVRCIQGLLYAAGYDPNGFDGEFGAGMETAVKAFQKDHGLGADGEVGADTLAALIEEVFKK